MLVKLDHFVKVNLRLIRCFFSSGIPCFMSSFSPVWTTGRTLCHKHNSIFHYWKKQFFLRRYSLPLTNENAAFQPLDFTYFFFSVNWIMLCWLCLNTKLIFMSPFTFEWVSEWARACVGSGWMYLSAVNFWAANCLCGGLPWLVERSRSLSPSRQPPPHPAFVCRQYWPVHWRALSRRASGGPIVSHKWKVPRRMAPRDRQTHATQQGKCFRPGLWSAPHVEFLPNSISSKGDIVNERRWCLICEMIRLLLCWWPNASILLIAVWMEARRACCTRKTICWV